MSATVNTLVIAGGASGGGSFGGGGGAGGYQANTALAVTAQAYTITVGAGGVGVTGYIGGNAGANSIFSTITANGGGRGGGYDIGAGQ